MSTNSSSHKSSAPSAAFLVRDHRESWRRGERMSVEAYLRRHQWTQIDPADLLDLIYGEIILREEDGETPELQEYLDRFPEHHQAVRDQFEVHQALRSSAPFSVALTSTFRERSDYDEEFDEQAIGSHDGSGAFTHSSIERPQVECNPEPDPAPDPALPRVVGFDVLGVLGSGGMGTVYRAYDRKYRRIVALKTMNRAGAAAVLRFKHEFRSLLDVVHPNLVSLYELMSDGRSWFLTMELLDGVNFLEYVRSPEGRPFERLRAALRQLAEGIAALHAAGKLHRDVKPSNVIVTREGRVVLLDFGLAAEQDEEGRHQSTEQHLVGTASYMAPEQAASLPVSPASDWYSVGVMLFEALTGRLPFSGGMIMVLMDKQRLDAPAPTDLAPGLPEDLSRLCVDLLQRRPEDRPSGAEILGRLSSVDAIAHHGGAENAALAKPPSTHSAHGVPLVGREHHLAVLRQALDDVRAGRQVAVYLHGTSGAGKTALLQSFLDEQTERGEAVVLVGRCYERESVPYKALDSLIDALARHLGRLSEVELAAVLPRDVGSLARVFPSLRRIEAVGQGPRRGTETPDPQELRRRAFSALRELLARLGDRKPLILTIDDLQWGDSDSAAVLIELMRPPDAPVLLFLATYRSEDQATSPLLRALSRAKALGDVAHGADVPDARELRVEPLRHDEACTLVATLLGSGSTSPNDRAALVEAVARESQGNPFFVVELVRHVQGGEIDEELKRSGGKLVLDDVLWSRIRGLPNEAREVLEVICVSGRPLRVIELSQCLDEGLDEHAALAILRAGRLVRGTGRAETGEVETYHDRVRETVAARLSPETTRDRHRRLAFVLESSGQADPEVLGVHFLGAEMPQNAGRYFAVAADEAAETLAFERAAALYRRALELGQLDPARRASLQSRLGDALANAGRGIEAAGAYLAGLPDSSTDEALELQRRAAMQFLISGHIDDGLATLQSVLARVGMTLPSTPRHALLSLLWQRTRLRLRGLSFHEIEPSRLVAADLTRIDVCWSAAVGLSVVDTIRGADFQARGLLLSLAAGEPSRIARALAMEAAHAASTGGSNRRRTESLLATAESLARRVEHPYALGMVTLARGVSSYLEGRWRAAQEQCDAADVIFRDRCTGVGWERNTAHAFSLWGLSHQGETAELSRRWPVLLAEAVERGNLYAAMNLSSYLMSIVRLAADEPERARAELHETNTRWSRQGYHVQHNDALWAAVQIELYVGDGRAAWKLIDESWPALKRSLLLRVQFVRTSMHFLRARAALAASRAHPGEARRMLASAARDAHTLERERMPCPTAYAKMIRASLATLEEDRRAATLWREAVALFEAVDMNLCAAAARRRLGRLLGGDVGRDEISRSEAWMRRQEIHDFEKTASMIAPISSP